MADKQLAPIIIRKKKGGGGHGAHGGAWKVAYADFVTAMMAFFLVMWLMGSDDETKEAISHYFNHPNTPFNAGKDPASTAFRPMGERSGQGDSILSGMNGAMPDDLVANPVRSEAQVEKYREIGELVREVTDGQAFDIEVEIDYLKFSVPESVLFVKGTTQLRDAGKRYLNRVGRVLQGFRGFVTIESHTEDLVLDGHKMSSLYETSIVKSVSVMKYFIEHNLIPQGADEPEERIRPVGGTPRRKGIEDPHSKEGQKFRSIEFTLTHAKKNY